jgi:Ca2+-binding RTX toxin-like protein
MLQFSRLIESLETRRLLSASATVTAAGVLTVEPFAGTPNTITVEAGVNQIDVSVIARHGHGQTFSTIIPTTGANVTAPTSIFVQGSQEADNIEVGVSSNLLLPTTIDGLAGNDSIEVGQQSATILEGSGKDSILAGNGADIIRCGSGADTIVVGNGNDKINGGGGRNIITAGDGNDIIVGGSGADIIHAGNGNDEIFGGPGNDLLVAGNGNDSLWGGPGRDTLDAGSGADTFGIVLGKNLASGTGPDKYVVRSFASLEAQITTYNPAKGDTYVISSTEAAPPVI